MDQHKIAIIVPAFNEEGTIYNVVRSVEGYGTVIVVNDASTDNTQRIATNAGAIVVSHKKNQGYDGALNSGFRKAEELNFNAVITFDADGQHNPDLLKEYILLINQGFVVVSGVRHKFQRTAERVFSWVSKWKWRVSDPLCGMKAYHLDLYRELGCFDSYKSIGTELLIFASIRKKKIAQVPVHTRDRIDISRFGGKLSSNILILNALWNGYRKYGGSRLFGCY